MARKIHIRNKHNSLPGASILPFFIFFIFFSIVPIFFIVFAFIPLIIVSFFGLPALIFPNLPSIFVFITTITWWVFLGSGIGLIIKSIIKNNKKKNSKGNNNVNQNINTP